MNKFFFFLLLQYRNKIYSPFEFGKKLSYFPQKNKSMSHHTYIYQKKII